ncbi:extracellular solute-binding protein [Streptacidiphilus fuscans]|uniref:Extracellular solute-binding protein n=1 Tax=Streptacidiphilus fuscans TaxID=2789292 RepID=A0A931FBL0_9ACTN|nr:extracellular solute-binding protein [Streptacidiphilus fuscans]MBF9067563.1 extracellular solute-binding protein [Streptacidiphilus fuscans]
MVALALSACGPLGLGSAASSPSPTSWRGQKLVVWLMSGDNPPSWVSAVTAEFERTYPGATVEVDVQQWSGIQTTVDSALATVTPPDVVDIGNTQTPYYASTGGLLDLTPYLSQLGASQWTASMDRSTVYQGRQYAAPWYAGNRVVMYNKLLWKKAGLTTPPATQDEWVADLTRLQNTAGVSSALWLPGQNWYAFDGFLQDDGAQIVRQNGRAWDGNLDSPAALQAAALFEKLQAFGNAPKDGNEANQYQAFAKGDVGCMIAMGYEGDEVVKADPALAGQIGWFPIPGRTAEAPARTFLGGSDLTVAMNSQHRVLALGFLKIALDDANESLMAKDSGFLPNRASLYGALAGNAYAQAAAKSVPYAGYTPLVPTWGNVEESPNPVVTLFLTPVLEGRDPKQAAEAADREMTVRLAW